MTSDRVSLYIPDRLAPILDLQAERGESLSGRLAAIVDRYGWIVRDDPPAFPRNEWCLILDACNGWASWAEAGETLMGGVAANVADHAALNAADEKWHLSRDEVRDLVARLNGLSRAQTCQVIECIERFWRRCELPTYEALAAAGCRIAED